MCELCEPGDDYSDDSNVRRKKPMVMCKRFIEILSMMSEYCRLDPEEVEKEADSEAEALAKKAVYKSKKRVLLRDKL